MDEFTVSENIKLALELQGKATDKETIQNILNQVDLNGYGNRKPNTLSGGQKQRVAIARALIKDPEIIMADEPTGALDSKTGEQVLTTLKKLSKEKLIFVVSHDRDFAERYADRIIELADGKIISDVYKHYSTPEQLTDGVSIIDGNILTINKGHKLNQNDAKVINEFLANNDTDIIISRDIASNKAFKKFSKITDNNKKETFKDTSPNDLKLNNMMKTALS